MSQINTIGWPNTFRGTSVNLNLDVAIDNISEKYTMFVPINRAKKCKV